MVRRQPNGTHLEEVTLLSYEKSSNTEDFVHNMKGYLHADEWEGGAWLTTAVWQDSRVVRRNESHRRENLVWLRSSRWTRKCLCGRACIRLSDLSTG